MYSFFKKYLCACVCVCVCGGGGGGEGLVLYVPGNSYGHVQMVSSPNNTFFLGKLDQVVNQNFVHLLSLVTDNNPS